MTDRADQLRYHGVVSSRDRAAIELSKPGDAVVVKRGRPRMLVMRCPCGCGDDLLVNLDRRVGPAWRYYSTRRGLTLYPSYWREGNCGSHFIIWNDRIYWCYGGEGDESEEWSVSPATEEAVFQALPEDFFSEYYEIADDLMLIPWEALQACRQLVRRGDVISDKFEGSRFRRRSAKDEQNGKRGN